MKQTTKKLTWRTIRGITRQTVREQTRQNARKRILRITAILILTLLAAGLLYSLLDSKYGLECTSYSIYSEAIETSFRVLQITDLHNSEFGEENERLVALAAEQSPDIILITGDLVDSGEESTEVAENLVSRLCGICPVYVSFGNQEQEHEEAWGSDLTLLYENAGATVLEREYMDISVNGQEVRLGGIYGYCVPSKYLATGEADAEECEFLWEFQDTDLYTILMCHMPVCWILNDGLDEYSVDCVFAGHVHGGQVILPFVGGLYGPDFGWFPGSLEGLYYSSGGSSADESSSDDSSLNGSSLDGDSTDASLAEDGAWKDNSSDGSSVLVLSRGLGSTEMLPRFNNTPEIVVVDILPKEEEP